MTTSEFDSYRPPEPPRKKRKKKGRRRGPGRTDGSAEMMMVPDVEFDSYYGRPVVKAPPWESPIGIYLFLGGIAGGSSLLGLGAQLTGREQLRRNSRLSAITAAGAGSVALIADLGRPERFLNMFRVFKLSSPMNLGSWLLGAFSLSAAIAAAPEADRLTGRRLPLPKWLRRTLDRTAAPAGATSAAFGAPLAVYTAVLLSDTSVPTWNEAKDHLPFVFASSAGLASGGLAMITTPVQEAGPARALAVGGAVADIAATKIMEKQMNQVAAEPLHQGLPGQLLKWSERLVVAGGVGALLGGRSRLVSVLSGAALLTGSAFTRFGILHAGLESVKDPRYAVEPQRQRLAARRGQGQTGDAITTAR